MPDNRSAWRCGFITVQFCSTVCSNCSNHGQVRENLKHQNSQVDAVTSWDEVFFELAAFFYQTDFVAQEVYNYARAASSVHAWEDFSPWSSIIIAFEFHKGLASGSIDWNNITQYWACYAKSVSSSVFIQQWIRKIDKVHIFPLNTSQAVIYLSLLLGLWDDLTWFVSPWKHANMSVLILIQLTLFFFFLLFFLP